MGDLIGLVAVVMGTLTILIPIAGFTARFALKPIAESVARMRESRGAGEELSVVEQRVALLERQMSGMESQLHRLSEVREFEAQLQAPPPAAGPSAEAEEPSS